MKPRSCLADQRLDLPAVEEERGPRSGSWSVVVRRDVRADEPELTVADVRVGALEVRLALTERLDLGSRQDQAGLVALEQVVLVPRLVSAITFSAIRSIVAASDPDSIFPSGRLISETPTSIRSAERAPLRAAPDESRGRSFTS